MNDDTRTLGPEMKAEGWIAIGDLLMWCHEPSHRCIVVDPSKLKRVPWSIRAVDTVDPETDGYRVECTRRNEHGEPLEGESFWVASYAEAIRQARKIRQSIMDERERKRASVTTMAEQMTLDDLNERTMPLAWAEACRLIEANGQDVGQLLEEAGTRVEAWRNR